MKITFYGAAKTVTGSKHLIKTQEGFGLLLDCGLFQGYDPRFKVLNRHFGFNPMEVNAVVLSHAHIDHSGLLPMLVKQGFSGPIYCTEATGHLLEIMLLDSAHIQEADAAFHNKRHPKDEPRKPLYTIKDVEKCLKLVRPVPSQIPFELSAQIKCTLVDNGHLLGSVAVVLEVKEQGKTLRVGFTGDIGRPDPGMLKPPIPLPEVDYLICESTYGDRLHKEENFGPFDLRDLIQSVCIRKKGKLLIPAFSIGRTQELIFAMDYLHNFESLPEIPIFVDSPLATKGTEIFKNHLSAFNERFQRYLSFDASPFSFPNLHFPKTVDESKAIHQIRDGAVVVSASGMMDAGRIRHHLFNHLSNPKNAVLVVGYAEPSTLGGQLISGAASVRLFGEDIPVRAKIVRAGSFSGHADWEEMLEYLCLQKPEKLKTVFLVHGEEHVQKNWANRLQENGFSKVLIPDLQQEFEIG